MSNNAPDYNDNLVFPPRHDKTALELQIENNKLKEQLAEHKENCCCAKNEVLLLEINRLREALKEIARNKTTEEQQGNHDYVDEDGDLIGDFEYAYDEFIKIARKALIGESEEK